MCACVVCACVSIYVCVVCVHTCTHPCTLLWKSEDNIVLFYCCPAYFPEIRTLTEPKFTVSARLACPASPRVLPGSIPQHWGYTCSKLLEVSESRPLYLCSGGPVLHLQGQEAVEIK